VTKPGYRLVLCFDDRDLVTDLDKIIEKNQGNSLIRQYRTSTSAWHATQMACRRRNNARR
jgi:hypothetical protein